MVIDSKFGFNDERWQADMPWDVVSVSEVNPDHILYQDGWK